MIKSIIKIGLLLVIGILGYNYFFGTDEEKAQAKKIIGKTTDIGKDAYNLLKEEANKFKSGKYDDALDNIAGLLEKTKEKVKDGGEMLNKIEAWEEKKSNWTRRKEALTKEMENGNEEDYKDEIKRLNDMAEKLEEEGKSLKQEAESN